MGSSPREVSAVRVRSALTAVDADDDDVVGISGLNPILLASGITGNNMQ